MHVLFSPRRSALLPAPPLTAQLTYDKLTSNTDNHQEAVRMKKHLRIISPLLYGAAYTAFALLLSQVLIRCLADLFTFFGRAAGLDDSVLSYGYQILAPLRHADIRSPWLPVLITGAAAGLLFLGRIRSRRGRILCLTGMLLLLPLLTLGALWLTSVNDIIVGNLLQSVLPIIPHLL